MNIKRLSIIYMVILSFLVIPSNYLYSEEVMATALDALVDEALKNNPQIRATYNKYLAARYKVTDVSSFPEPMGMYGVFGEHIETRLGPQEHKYGISQKVPFPLKLYLKGKAALKHSDMLKEEYEATKREIIKEVKFVYYDIYWLDKALSILDEEKSILESLEKVARMKFEADRAPQQDAIKAAVEISKIIDRIFVIREQRNSKAAMLNNLLNRPKGTPLGKAGDVGFKDFNYQRTELHDLASKNRQELIEANINIERAKYEKSLSQLNFIPDLTFGFDYISIGSGSTTMPHDGRDAWMTTFAVNIPIWFDKLYAQIMEKKADLKAAKENFTGVENRVAYEIEDIYFKTATYKDIVSLYKTALIPQTEQSFEAARTGYETGEVDFLNWLDAERVLLQTRLAYYKAVVDYLKSIAYLERVVGADL